MSKVTRGDLAHALDLHKAGRLADAEKAYSKYLAVHPDDPAALNNAAAAALQFGNPALAIARFEKLVALDPRHAHGYSNLGYALVHSGRSEEAVGYLERAVAMDPSNAMAHNNLGIAYEHLSRHTEAIGAFERALALAPKYADPAANLGEILNRDGDTAGARAALTKALAAQPAHIGARASLARTDALDGELEDALATLERIVVSAPRDARFWQVLGALRTWAGDLAGGEAAYRNTLALDPHRRQAWFGVAAAQLARGDFARGWRAFEQRPDGCFGAASRFGDIPQWDGARLDGALLLICEQGLGDVVQFARFVPEARKRVRRLIFLLDGIRQSLAPLLATLSGIDDVYTDAEALATLAERPIARASVLSLPYLVEVRVESLPGPIPYVSPLEERTAVWKPRLEAIPRPRVGFAWAAFARREIGYVTRQKTVPLSLLAPVIAASSASFVSLQLGAAGNLALHGELARRIVDFTTDIHDFGDTAAIIAELDLVISSDTSVAHVAGAMGKPVWMLDRYNTCWRWRLAADRSPWYPTMRIFRQQKFGDWSEPLKQLAAALGEWGQVKLL
jgi:Flp pilus assembly protein TadD